MKNPTIEEEIELIVNFYAKKGEKDALKAALKGLVNKVKQENK